MIRFLLKFGLWGLGVSAILIGSALSLFGPETVANVFNHTFLLYKFDGSITDLGTTNIESELRFFGMMFVFYGVCLIAVVRNYTDRFQYIPPLLLVFFLAGLGRLIGFFTEGAPHLLFRSLMYIELGLPVVLLALWVLERKRITV